MILRPPLRPLLRSLSYKPTHIRYQSSNASPQPKTAIFFPGQGTQRVGMISDFLDTFPEARQSLEQADEILKFPLSKIIREGPPDELVKTENAQPAILAASCAIMAVLEKRMPLQEHVAYALGHSLGEFAALKTSGILGFAESVKLVRLRGEAMAKAVEEYGRETAMYALVVEKGRSGVLIDAIEQYVDDFNNENDVVAVANHNSSGQVVISGTRDGLLKCISHLRTFSGHDPRPVKLNVSAPFHTSILQPAVAAVHDALSTMHLSLPAKIPVISNVTAREFPDDPKQLKILVEQQTVRRVRWYESVEYLHEHCGVQRWLGIGPGNVSRNLIGRELGMEKVWGLSSVGELDGVLEMLASDILTRDQDPQEGATY